MPPPEETITRGSEKQDVNKMLMNLAADDSYIMPTDANDEEETIDA